VCLGDFVVERMARLSREFFARDTLAVARELLGTRLVRMLDGQRLSGVIMECEAYIGEDDTACHASKGRTPRNEVMFGPPGYAYVYFTYGMHWMLNVVTEENGFPAAVLVRAIEPVEGIEIMRALRQSKGNPHRERDLTSGPARLTQALAIDRTLNGTDLVAGDQLWLEPGDAFPDDGVERGPRIGIRYAAEKDQRVPWRFWVRDNSYVSR
jgi:DNA-3-methyladenine glycosylase